MLSASLTYGPVQFTGHTTGRDGSDYGTDDAKDDRQELKAAIQRLIAEARIDELENLGKPYGHDVFCRKKGEQFKECFRCLTERRLAELQAEKPGKGV